MIGLGLTTRPDLVENLALLPFVAIPRMPRITEPSSVLILATVVGLGLSPALLQAREELWGG